MGQQQMWIKILNHYANEFSSDMFENRKRAFKFQLQRISGYLGSCKMNAQRIDTNFEKQLKMELKRIKSLPSVSIS